MTILFLALVSLLAVAMLIIMLFEDELLKDFESMQNAKLDQNVYRVMESMKQWGTSDIEEIEQELNNYDYELIVLKDGQIVYGKLDEKEKELICDFNAEKYDISYNSPELFYHQKTTIVGQYIDTTVEYIMAAHFFNGEWWLRSFQNSFLSFFSAFLLAGAAVIAILLFLSSLFTKRMVKKIMEPLDALLMAAERIKAGNLTQEIIYSGEGEFEEVCNTFNAMQKTMLADKEQRLKNEKARTDMVTGISHDLRTPLTSIRGYIKGVLDGVADTPEKKKVYLQTAYEATGEMNLLLQKLFDFSRMESGQMPLYLVEADLGEFVDAYVAQKELTLEKAQVEISYLKTEEFLPEIQMDVEQMRRILDNLLENSMKYANVVPVKIRIRIYEEDSDVIMEWKDNGQGVPENKLEKIFERFYRHDEARTKKGSGVGLYVAKYIVEQHGGSICAQNDDGFLIRIQFPKV